MEKHVKLVGILNIVYRSLAIIGAMVLLAIAVGFGYIYDALVQTDSIQPHEIPAAILDLIPLILFFVASLIIVVSVAGIIGGIGVLKRKEWGRVLLLVVSFFNLIRIPLGTVLGVYTIWVLINNETIKLFVPASSGN
jgi:hypothetical protein